MSRSTIRKQVSMATVVALLSGVLLAVSVPAAAAAATVVAAEYQQVELARGPADVGEPMTLTVAPDLSVLHTARGGALRRTDHAGNTTTIGTFEVYHHDEEGLQGVALDPNFATNRAIFVYYAPKLTTPTGDAPATGTAATWATWAGYNRLSRFTLNADWTVNMASEKPVLDVATSRGICCHVGGDMDFDAAGNLYLTTGDDTNPFDSGSSAPIDERANRNPAYDAQRSAANTNDLRGKLLRIKVRADGTYTIPAGNLFAPGTAKTRPEIYAMGFRNPFRMTVDKATGVVYLGDYGPDAAADSNRGPGGQVEHDRIPSAGNYGWPYCTGTNTAAETYAEWDFATSTAGPKFDCAGGPTNNSPHNTGLTRLPPARPAWIKYGRAGGAPEFGPSGSESPMGGPVYDYDAASTSSVKFPAALDGTYFAGEFGRKYIKAVAVNADGSRGAVEAFPWKGTQVMDMAFGPDGALYVLDYGTGSNFVANANAALYRIEHVTGANRAPTAAASASTSSGPAPLTTAFSSAGSVDPEGGALRYAWTFGDGTSATVANPSHTYSTNGVYTVTLTVTDPGGLTGSTNNTITVGNTAPLVTLTIPGNGQLFNFGDTVPYSVSITDPEDGAIDCSKVTVTYVLGHDDHAHAITAKTGCSGSIAVPVDGEHDPGENIYGVFVAEYTDKGANGQPPLTGNSQSVLQPKHRQAEHFSDQSGVSVLDAASAEGGGYVGNISNGDWVAFTPYKINNATSVSARIASAGVGGTLSIRTGSPSGAVLGSVAVPVTGGWEKYQNVSTPITNPPNATATLYLTFAGPAGALFNVDSYVFTTATSTPRITGTGGSCVDVSGGVSADGTALQLATCNGTPAQTWTRDAQTIRALGKCMDVKSAGSADATPVQLFTCNATAAQQWAANAAGGLVNTGSGKCLDSAGGSGATGAKLQIRSCTGSASQKWLIS